MRWKVYRKAEPVRRSGDALAWYVRSQHLIGQGQLVAQVDTVEREVLLVDNQSHRVMPYRDYGGTVSLGDSPTRFDMRRSDDWCKVIQHIRPLGVELLAVRVDEQVFF